MFSATITLLAPLVTSTINEVRAVPRKGPAVVECPDYGDVASVEVLEEYLVVDVVSVYVVQMHNVGFNELYLLN